MSKKITLNIDEQTCKSLESVCSNSGKEFDEIIQDLIVESIKDLEEFAHYKETLESVLQELEDDPSKEAKAIFTIKSWDEEPFAESSHGGFKLTKAKIVKEYQGDMQGIGKLEYLMMYESPNSAVFQGFERFTGSIHGKKGDCIFKHIGTFEEGIVNSCWEVISFSGTKELEHLEGEVYFSAGHAQEYPICFEYSFEIDSFDPKVELADMASMRDQQGVKRIKHEDAWE